MGQIAALRHVPFEDLGLLEGVLHRRGHDIRYIEAPTADLDRELEPLAPDLVVVLGGPIAANQDEAYPFLAEEAALLRERMQAGRPTLGLCLGAQLMARALGGPIHPDAVKELGWGPITLTEAGQESCLRHLAGEEVRVLHWHGDTFELPEGATRLAATSACPNQAFLWGSTALALQFHMEVTHHALEAWWVGNARDIAATPEVTVPGLRTDTARWAPVLRNRAEAAFGEWLGEVGL